VVDRTGEAPWKRSLLTSRLIEVIRDPSKRVICVLNTTGRARLLACRRCRELARCETCGAAVTLDDDGRLACSSCGTVRPMVCAACGATAFANLRPGVSRLREELEAAAGRPVASVTGADDTGEVIDASVVIGTEAALHRVPRADVVAFLDFDREMLAPRYRAAEEAMSLLVRAARRAGRRDQGGRILVQTFVPQHEVLRAAVLADPGRLTASELERRRALSLPPFTALAEVAGDGSDEFVGSLRGVEVGGTDGHYLVRAPTTEALCDALAAGRRPADARLRLSVDPLRV
jgi:primosomal protein N' (replication factor Y)